MEELQRKGLTKSIGISNFNSQQIERLLKSADIVPVTNQVRKPSIMYNIFVNIIYFTFTNTTEKMMRKYN